MSSGDLKYTFASPAAERTRLRRLAQACEEPTRAALRSAGVSPGMRCLDMGCGPGEVMRLLGAEVEPGGKVTGMDLHASLPGDSLSALRTSSTVGFDFRRIDIELVPAVPGGPYDVVFSRLLLPHVKDPAGTVRKLYDSVAPGGVLLLQEFDNTSWQVHPPFDGSDLPRRTLAATFSALGKDPQLAYGLPLLLRAAGATGPVDLRGNSWISSQGPEGAAELLGALEAFRSTALATKTVSEPELHRFEQDLRQHYRTNPWSYQLSPTLVSAWTRKPLHYIPPSTDISAPLT